MKRGRSFRRKYFAGDHHERRPIAERRYAFSFCRDPLTELYTIETGRPEKPRSGSRVVRRALASVMIAWGVNQIIRLPQLRRDASYSRQFVTR